VKQLAIILLFIGFSLHGFSQDFEIISLKKLVKKSDTPKEEKIDAFISLSKAYDGDSAIYFAVLGKEYAQKINYPDGVAKANSRLAIYHIEKGNFELALDFYYEILRDSAKISPKIIGSSYNGLGSIYRRMEEYDKALAIYDNALIIANQTQKPLAFASVYNNKAIIYDLIDKLDTSLLYYNKCLEYIPLIKDKQISIRFNYAILVNMGILYSKKNEDEKALTNYEEALAIGRNENNDYFIANALMTIGGIYTDQKKYVAAESKLKEALNLSIKGNTKFLIRGIHNILHRTYKGWGKNDLALVHYENYIAIKDSITGEDIKNNMNELEVKYDTEKKEQALKLSNTKLKHEEFISTILLWIGLLGFIVIAFITYQFFQKKKQNKEIEHKNLLITDSIDYAKRIQKGVYPAKEDVWKLFPNIMVYLNPKDIVSGDFYWVYERGGKKYLAVADCTGHGVPGAFMTIIGINILNDIMNTKEILSPAEIVSQLNKKLREQLSVERWGGKDGMDIALICIDEKEKSLQFCGTHLSCYIVENKETTRLRGDNVFIGLNERVLLSNQNFSYNSGSTIYLFTDGFPDQKGEEKTKKYYYAPLIDFLVSTSALSTDKQYDKVKKEFHSFKGSYEQIDDVLVVGLKV